MESASSHPSEAAEEQQQQQPVTSPDDAIHDKKICDVISADASNDVKNLLKKTEGPLGSFVRGAVDQLDKLDMSDNSVTSRHNDVIMQRVAGDLVTSYKELGIEERLEVEKQLIDILFVLTSRGLDVNAFCDTDKKQTMLHVIACLPDNAKFIKTLHAAGARINAADNRQQTALHIAAMSADLSNVQALVDSGAHLDAQDSTGQTPLHLACTGRRHVKIVQFLIRCRAKTSVQDCGGRTALHVAARSARPELVRILVVHGATPVNTINKAGQTALHLAAMHDVSGRVLAELLTNKAIDVNARDCISKQTALHCAMRLNMLDNVLALLRRGADPNLANISGQTTLHLAARSLRDLRVWNALVKAGGKLDLQTASGLSVLGVAAKASNSVAKAVIGQFDAVDEFTVN